MHMCMLGYKYMLIAYYAALAYYLVNGGEQSRGGHGVCREDTAYQ